jgi:hypothetical protein
MGIERTAKLKGYLIITIYQYQRRWYGAKKSRCIIETAVPLPNANDEGDVATVELRHTILKGWTLPQYEYIEHRVPATILEIGDDAP